MAIPDVSTDTIYEGELQDSIMSQVTHIRGIIPTGAGSILIPKDEFKLPASQIKNDSSVTGATVDDALTQLNTAKAADNSVVHSTGNETVAGVKTFSSSPIVPNPTTSTQADNKGSRELADSQFYAKAIEPIAPNATAPTPDIPIGTTKTYEFSSGGVCAWLDNQVVEKGDKVTVAFTAPSTFVRTYQNVVSRKVDDSQIVGTTGTSETNVMHQKGVTIGLSQVRKDSNTPYFTGNKTFGLSDEWKIYLLRNALLKCVWHENQNVEKIGIYAYQISGTDFMIWFGNCDNLASDDIIPLSAVFAKAQTPFAGYGIKKIDIIRLGNVIGYVIVDLDMLNISSLLVESTTPSTYANSGISIIEVGETEIIMDDSTKALKQSLPVTNLNWGVKLLGESGSSVTPNSDIVLSQDGDEIEIAVMDVVSTLITGGYAFTKGIGQDLVRGIFVTKTKLSVRADDGTWLFSDKILNGAYSKFKIVYESGNIKLYINDILISAYAGQKTLTIIGFGNGVVTQYPEYWEGVIVSIKHNTNNLSFFDDFILGEKAVIYRAYNFLTDEQALKLAAISEDLYVSKSASIIKMYKKISDSEFIMYPLEYRLKTYTANQYPSYYDNWGIGIPKLCIYDGTMVEVGNVFSGAEAELAMTTPDAKDGTYTFVGGAMHGFENITLDGNNVRNIRILINGIKIEETDVIDLMPIQSIDVLQESKLTQAYSNTNPFATVLKNWTFNKDGLKISASLTFIRSVVLRETYTGMFGVLRRWGGNVLNDYLANRAIKKNQPFVIYDVSDGWESLAINDSLKARDINCTEIKMYGEKGLGFKISIENATVKNGGMSVRTNGGQAYNKIYYDLTGNYTPSINEELHSTQIWTIE